ncbi:hypothetical protein Tco_1199904 [Tanacetum coccineum]
MNQFAEAFSSILGIVDAYLANKMHEAVQTTVQLQSERLRDEAQAENADFLNKLDDNIKKIIKDQVKEQVKAQVSKILPKIEKTVNEQLEAEVMTRSSTESKTSLAIAANLSELELKKILIDKMESNKSIHRSDEQKNLYKALVDAYKSDKLILDTYGDTVSFKRQSTSAPKEKTSKTSGKSYEGSKSKHKTAGESAQTEEPMHTTKDLEEPAHQEFETGVTEDQPNEETPQFPDWLKVDTLTAELLTSPTFGLTKGSCKSLVELEYLFKEPLPLIPNSRGRHVIPFDHFINNDLEYLSGGVSSRKYATLVTKTKAADYEHIKWIEDLVPNRMWSQVPDVYSKCRIIAVIKLEIVDWHNHKHLDWITNKDKKNRLMRIDELHKFSDGTLNDVRIALNDHLKGIQMEYLPQNIWRQSEEDKVGAMI